jgi:hypothetical protein
MAIPPKPNSGWKSLGRTSNTEFFMAGDGILVALPDAGLKDDLTSAQENASFQVGVARESGRTLGIVVFMTSLLSQNGDARRVYGERMEPALFRGVALIVTNPLSRAIGSFSVGLNQPRIPTRLVSTFEEGVDWLGSLNPERAAS